MENEVVRTPDVTLDGVVDELFSHARTSFTLRDGTEVVFEQAKFKHIAKITALFETLMQRVPKDRLLGFIDLVADAQALSMEQGKSQYEMQIEAGEIFKKAIGESSVLLAIFGQCMDVLPDAVPLFSNLSREAFENLDIDEALVAAAGVVAVNYAFFTQHALPILRRVLGGLKSGR